MTREEQAAIAKRYEFMALLAINDPEKFQQIMIEFEETKSQWENK